MSGRVYSRYNIHKNNLVSLQFRKLLTKGRNVFGENSAVIPAIVVGTVAILGPTVVRSVLHVV